MGKCVAGSSLETFLRRFCLSFSVVVYVVSLVFSLVFSLSETCVSARSINQRYSYQSSSSLSKDLKRKQQRTTTDAWKSKIKLTSIKSLVVPDARSSTVGGFARFGRATRRHRFQETKLVPRGLFEQRVGENESEHECRRFGYGDVSSAGVGGGVFSHGRRSRANVTESRAIRESFGVVSAVS